MLLHNTEEQAKDYCFRHGIPYLIVMRDGDARESPVGRLVNRVLLTIDAGRITKLECG